MYDKNNSSHIFYMDFDYEKFLDKNINLTKLHKIFKKESNLDTLKNLCDTEVKQSIGLNYIDVNFLYNFLNPEDSIFEIGCGTSTRIFNNLGNMHTTFALSDDHASSLESCQEIKFNCINVLDNYDRCIEEAEKHTYIFLDGCHSYNFIKNLYDNVFLKLKSKKTIICHDFFVETTKSMYTEQIYVTEEILNAGLGSLVCYTDVSLDSILNYNNRDLLNIYSNINYPHKSCIALISLNQ